MSKLLELLHTEIHHTKKGLEVRLFHDCICSIEYARVQARIITYNKHVNVAILLCLHPRYGAVQHHSMNRLLQLSYHVLSEIGGCAAEEIVCLHAHEFAQSDILVAV